MDDNINKQRFEKVSFWQLLKNRRVEIPIIQRDYAQGRVKKEKIRNDFLDTLKNALIGNPVELDFVYGNEENNVLQPLDGQQRLTTLFLLHWFVAVKEGKLDEGKKRLCKFTYETRTSSREFCQELIDKSIDYENLLPINEKTGITIENQMSETIKNASWFVISWKNDPTISAMLIMLDAIQMKFKGSSDLWQKLTEEDKHPITFLYNKLENFGISDDLYIKMNARGKPLTDFENFKAKFEKHINQIIYKTDENGNEILENGKKVILKDDWEKELKIQETDTEEVKKEKQSKMFSFKIDNAWTDLFWDYRNEDNKIDDSILKFMANTAMFFYAQNLEIFDDKNEKEVVRKELELKSKSKSVTDEAIKRERIERRIAKLLNDYSAIKPEDFASKEAFDYLIECFDIYSKDSNDKLSAKLSLWDFGNEDSSLFNDLINDGNLPTYKQRVLFYAQSNYVKNVSSKTPDETFSDWIRVVRNIVENATIDSATTFIGAINLIKELSKGCNDIYDFLDKNSIQSKFAEEQVKEEIRKAKLIVNDNKIKTILFELEDTSFCKGTINWCLECSDKVEELKKIKGIIDLHFSQNDISNLFRRALLTIGSNDFYNYWWSWSYGTNTHKKCLIENRNDLKNSFTKNDQFDNYLKPLIIQLCNNGNDLQGIVDSYTCLDVMPNWKCKLIKQSDLLDEKCEGHYMGITDDDKHCYLYGWKKRPTSRDECYLVE